jgi:hypothetical protein
VEFQGGCVEPGALLDETAVGLRQTEYSFVGRFARREGKLADSIRLAARLLHRPYGLHPHKVRDDRYLTSRLEATSVSFVLGVFCELRMNGVLRSSHSPGPTRVGVPDSKLLRWGIVTTSP